MSTKSRMLLRATLAMLGLASSTVTGVPDARAQAHEHRVVREIEILVQSNYAPSRIEVHEGERIRLKFVRKESSSCTREVVFPALDIRRELPPNHPVFIELPALGAGEYEFKCGMNMIHGTLVVTAHNHH